jgi:ligand-binding sensor domain-containing protein/DNA-binding CsgD family transcriptional regulator
MFGGSLLLFVSFFAQAQNTIGLPEILNYPKKVYGAGTQNWDIKQDAAGVMYFANNEGLLSFDGTYWSLYPLPNRTVVRSLLISSDNKIYVGGQDEIGYFAPDKDFNLVYTSLRNLVPEKDRAFADIWDIVASGNDIFFRSTSKIFQLSAGQIAVYRNDNWRFLGLNQNRLFAQSASNGLLVFQNGIWKPFANSAELRGDFVITSILPISQDSSLIATLKDGLYLLSHDVISKFTSPDIEKIAPSRFYNAVAVDSTTIALATSLDGCFIVDTRGNLIQSFTRKEGLQNNNILSIYLDEDKNLWLGLDNGIDFIAFNDAVKHIYTDNLNPGSGYASIIYHKQLFIGTSNGLYSTPLANIQDLSYLKGSFQAVSNTKGQVWNLSVVNDQLLLGHHDGAFLVNNNNATLLDKSAGFWSFRPLYSVLPSSVMVAGTYNGLSFYNYVQGKFENTGKRVDFQSSRYVAIDDSTIWVGHPYMGVYKVQLNHDHTTSVRLYTNKNGLPSEINNCLYKIRNRIAVTTEKGIYEFDEAHDRFEPSKYFNHLFGDRKVRYMKEDGSGNIWFIEDKKMGVVDISNSRNTIIYFPELTNKMVSGFEYIDPVDNYNIFLGGENGFYHLNYEKYKKKSVKLEVRIRTVKTIGPKNRLLFGGYNDISRNTGSSQGRTPEIDFNQNSFHFDFASTQFSQHENIEFSTYLQGFDRDWSEWTKKTEKEYTNLSPGTYVFQVKTRNNIGNESDVCTYTFIVLPPWYRTYWAYAFYALILFALAYLFYKRQQMKFARQQGQHEEEQKRLLYLHQLELEKTEKEIVKLKNEKLEAEIQHKNTELASVAMHLLQKGEMLSKIKGQLNRARSSESQPTDDLKKIGRMLNEEDKVDSDWELFAMHFDKVHSDFLAALKAHSPNLTSNELKLCAYLKMNLSTKEIAQLMNIATRGVEISRYRLRKKLQIPRDENLFNYLLKITSQE